MALGASPQARDPLDDIDIETPAPPQGEVLAAAPADPPAAAPHRADGAAAATAQSKCGSSTPTSSDGASTALGASPLSSFAGAGPTSEDSPPGHCTPTSTYDPAVERRARALAFSALFAACVLSALVLFRPPLPMVAGVAWQTARPALRMGVGGGGAMAFGNLSEAAGVTTRKRYKSLSVQEGHAIASTTPPRLKDAVAFYRQRNASSPDSPGNVSMVAGVSTKKRYKFLSEQEGRAIPSNSPPSSKPGVAVYGKRNTTGRKRPGVSKALSAKEAARREARMFKSRPLIFVHVPKVAGTAIAAATEDLDLPIPVRAACWRHTPPDQHVRGGFVVVRPVIERLISEYKWVRRRPIWYEVLQAENDWPDAEDWPCTCKTFNQWLAAALRKLKEDPYFPDCHMVPQWCYASKVDYIVPYSDRLEESLQMLHPTLAEVSLEEVNSQGHDKKSKGGPQPRCRVTPACVSKANLREAKKHFQEDFEHLEPNIQSAIREAGGSAPRPWSVGLEFVLGPTLKKNRDCNVNFFGTKTLFSPSPCEPRERPPGVRKGAQRTCVPTMEECAQLAAKDADCSSTITYHGNREGPRGPYRGWCKCVRRRYRCIELDFQFASIATFAKPAALSSRCTPPPKDYRADLHLSRSAPKGIRTGEKGVHRGHWGREVFKRSKKKSP